MTKTLKVEGMMCMHCEARVKKALEALDRTYIAGNLSPGGSADLLALCFLLRFLKEAAP